MLLLRDMGDYKQSQQLTAANVETINAATSIVYEPVLPNGGYIVTIKYKYHISINALGVAPYIAPVTHKIISSTLTTEHDVSMFLGAQVVKIHKDYVAAKIISVDVMSKIV